MTCSVCYDLCTVLVTDHDTNEDWFTIGSIADADTSVMVLIENVGSEGFQVQEVTSDSSGNVEIDLRQDYFDHGQSFRLRVTERSYGQDFKDVTPPSGGSVTYKCLLMTVKRVV